MMKYLIWGCSINLKFLLEKFDIDYTDIDFTDSDKNKWNTLFIENKKIIPAININKNDYCFCIIGSHVYSESIKNTVLKYGFTEDQIVPYDYINNLWERWKKDNLHVIWKKYVEGAHIAVVKNWYMEGENAACIISISNAILHNIIINVLDVYKESRIITVYDLSKNFLIGQFMSHDNFTLTSDEKNKIIKIEVSKAIIGIPWFSFSVKKNEFIQKVEQCKVGKQLLSIYGRLIEFPFYDEDYIVLKRLKEVKGTILDVGANYGQSFYAFYNLVNSKIISIEVRPDLYEALLLLKHEIDFDNRIEIMNVGISEKQEELIWYEPTNPIMSGSFDVNFISARKLGVPIEKKIMKCYPLDELISKHNDIWFIKMDVEGLEYEALKGAKKIIESNYPAILIEQNEKLEAIRNLLKDKYDVFYYDIYADKFVEKRFSRLNCWLIPKEKYRNEYIKMLIKGRM